jgi:hypothetical protein
MALVDQIDLGAGFVNSLVRMSNTSGTVLVSAVDADSGEMIADEYTLTLSAVGGGTGTVTVGALSPNNPFNGRVKTSVALNGSTIYKDIIPGVSLVFSGSGANTNTASVKTGSYLGTFDSAGIGGGIPSSGVRHKVVNSSANTVTAAKAELLTQAIMVKKIGLAVSYVEPFADGATEKIAGGGSSRVMPYLLAISGVAGSGAGKTCNLSVDGVTLGAASVRDRATGILVSGTGLKAIDSYSYIIATGPLTGLIFNIDPACANSDTCNILIFPSRYIQIAPDVAGVEGAYGVVDVDLTQSGQATGTILTSQAAYYWSRILVPGSANNESNPYPAQVALTGVDAGAAGW